MQPPELRRRVAGQRDVDPVALEALVELVRGELLACVASIARSSAWRASLAALPVAARSSGGSSATLRSRFGSSALRPR